MISIGLISLAFFTLAWLIVVLLFVGQFTVSARFEAVEQYEMLSACGTVIVTVFWWCCKHPRQKKVSINNLSYVQTPFCLYLKFYAFGFNVSVYGLL